MDYQVLNKGNSSVCEEVLRSLPDWFGIEEAIQDYTFESQKYPMIIAREEGIIRGFLSLKKHSDSTYEVYVMGVMPGFHRRGIGRALLFEGERYLSVLGGEFLQVKTLSSARECEAYKKTRLFYKSLGFKEVEVFPTLWDESNPCLLMIKSIDFKVRGINHITLSVSNLERSFVFYKDILNFKPKFRSKKSAYFEAGSLWLALEEDPLVRKAALPEYTHIAFDSKLEDFEKLTKKIKEAGTTIFKENKSEGESLYFLDPDGHRLEIHVGDLESRLQEYRKKEREDYQFF